MTPEPTLPRADLLTTMLEGVLQRPTAVVLATATAVLLGAVSLFNLPVSVLPDVERPVGVAVVEAPGLSRLEITETIIEPMERRLRSIAGVVKTDSLVDDGVARIEFESEWQTDLDQLRIAAERARAALVDSDGIDLRIAVQSGSAEPVIEVAVRGGSQHQRTEYVERTVLPELARVEGAGEVRRIGGAENQIVVEPIAASLAARGLTVSDLEQRLARIGLARTAGAVRDGGVSKPVVIQERIESLDELERLLVGSPERIPLIDVADLSVEAIAERGFARLNGDDVILVEVHRAPEANAVRLAERTHETLARLSANSPEFELEVLVDRSLEVRSAISNLVLAALIGILLGVAVLRFFLGSFRPTLALATVIPCSILISFGPFLAFSVSVDVISIAGLVLALGMLVDSAIVVLDSTTQSQTSDPASPRFIAVSEGTRKITPALIAGFLTTAAVFVPLFYLEGLARAFFGVQAFAIVSCLLVALILSLTLVPVAVQLLRRSAAAHDSPTARFPGRESYLKLLSRALARPLLVSLVLLLASSTVIAVSLLFLPRALTDEAASSAARSEGRSEGRPIEATGVFDALRGVEPRGQRDLLLELEAALLETGAERLMLRYLERDPTAPGDRLKPPGGISSFGPLQPQLEALASQPGLASSFGPKTSPLAGTFSSRQDGIEALGSLSSVQEPLTLAISAATRSEARALADETQSRLTSLGIKSTRRTLPLWRRPAYSLRFQHAQLARLGLDVSSLRQQLQTTLGELRIGRVQIPGVNERLRLRSISVPNPGLLPVVSVSSAGGDRRTVTLQEIADLEPSVQEAPWLRRDGQPTLFVDLSLSGDHTPTALLAMVSSGLPAGSLRWTGESHEIERSFGQLRFALILAILLVFLCIAAIYESLALPLAVLATLPVATAGALAALLATSQSLNILSFLGLVLLVGIVVNNSIVLLHRVEERRRENPERPLHDTVALSAADRYRPILMTTLTTVLGLLPLAILGGEGAGMRRSLAIAVSSGLTVALLGSLILVPCVYLLCRRGR